jgi:hypothetical protein
MKKSKKAHKNKAFQIIILSIVGVTALYTLLPDYFQKGLIYLTPNIDDYKIFDNREVETDNPQPWPFSADYNQYTLSSASIKDSIDLLESTGLLVIQNDSLLFEE